MQAVRTAGLLAPPTPGTTYTAPYSTGGSFLLVVLFSPSLCFPVPRVYSIRAGYDP